MTWEDVVIETVAGSQDLAAAVDRLFARAESGWELWREGHQALGNVVVRTHGDGAERVLVQHNPARRRSVHAAVDAAAIAARPCFLCPASFPPGECGVAWQDLVLLPNPFPIVRRHLTIPTREHQPQALTGRARELVLLAQALGESMCTLYNGPRCGASAPDHLHFQAGLAALPAFELVDASPHAATLGLHAFTSFGRRFVALVDDDVARLGDRIEHALAAWGGGVQGGHEEPMCSVLVRWKHDVGTALFFPRRAHRPRVFFEQGDARIGVSPAALEMAGILVVSDPESMERLDAAAARTVYEDVSPTADDFAAFLERIR